jgi:hypothetical protein
MREKLFIVHKWLRNKFIVILYVVGFYSHRNVSQINDYIRKCIFNLGHFFTPINKSRSTWAIARWSIHTILWKLYVQVHFLVSKICLSLIVAQMLLWAPLINLSKLATYILLQIVKSFITNHERWSDRKWISYIYVYPCISLTFVHLN